MRRLAALIAALAIVVLGAGALPALADDDPSGLPTPTGTPSSRPGDPFGGQTLPPGDYYVVTPGSTASTLPPTADPEDVQQQVDEDIAKARTQSVSATPSATAAGTPSAGSTSSGPVEDLGSTSSGSAVAKADPSSSSPMLWWVMGIVVLGLAVGGVIVVRVRRRRSSGEAPGVP